MTDLEQTIAIVTIIALILGPVIAVIISKISDANRSKRGRRLDIFRTLMRTRRTPIHPDHVGALNLVEIEFQGEAETISAWKVLITHFAANHPRNSAEEIRDGMTGEEKNGRDNKYGERLHDERQKLLAKLLHAMAQVLGFKVEQLEIFEGGYTPQGWHDVELEQSAIRRYAVDLYLGRRVLPVSVVPLDQGGSSDPKLED